jgi:hypothetical protein
VTFAHDTTAALVLAADLVNTERGWADELDGLTDVTALEAFLHAHRMVPRRAAGPDDLAAVRDLRPKLAAAWETAEDPQPQGTRPEDARPEDARPRGSRSEGTRLLAAMANELLEESDARPWLTDHYGGWHLHVTRPDAPLVHRIAAQAGFAFADLVRLGETGRLRQCLAPDCSAVLVDLSRNRSRMYCDTGNCGNRQHVAAYRARRATHRTEPA